MATTFITSDTHFGHTNMVTKGYRKFDTIEAMDEAIIANWNATVRPGDTVYHLGDFAWKNHSEYFCKLNGNKHLVRGNHDITKNNNLHKGLRNVPFVSISDIRNLEVGKEFVVLCHFRMLFWNKRGHGSFHIHGHMHGSDPIPMDDLTFDVSQDVHGFTPVPLDRIVAELQERRVRLREAEDELVC